MKKEFIRIRFWLYKRQNVPFLGSVTSTVNDTQRLSTKCRNCDMKMAAIDENIHKNKFIQNFFQYDYITGELTTAKVQGYEFQLTLNLQ